MSVVYINGSQYNVVTIHVLKIEYFRNNDRQNLSKLLKIVPDEVN